MITNLTDKQINDIAFNDKMLKNAKYFEKLRIEEEENDRKIVAEYKPKRMETKMYAHNYYWNGNTVIDSEVETEAWMLLAKWE